MSDKQLRKAKSEHGNGQWPRISVVTISYNQSDFLEQAIRSVVAQDYPNLEYIVIDGGSTDGSKQIIERYQQHLAFSCSEPDGGPAAALNKGFRIATGEILCFLNSDDFFLPGALKQAASALASTSADVVYGDGYMVDSSGNRRNPIYSEPWTLKRAAYHSSIIVQPATFFTAESFRRTNGFDESQQAFWDAGLWVELALNGASFHHIKKPLAAFRLHSNSITGGDRLRRHAEDVMDQLFEKIMGRPKSAADRILVQGRRLLKFSKHPGRSIRSRLFVRTIR